MNRNTKIIISLLGIAVLVFSVVMLRVFMIQPASTVKLAVIPEGEYDPAVWGVYTPSWPELVIVAGSFGFFCQFFLIFLKLFPIVAIAEVKEIEIHAKAHGGAH